MYPESRNLRLLFAMVVVVALGGCKVGPDYVEPEMELPSAWSDANLQDVPSQEDLLQWWTILGDATLDELMERAVAGNLDVEQALYRVEQSRALRDYRQGRYYPNVDLSASYLRSRISAHGEAAGQGQPVDQTNLHSAGFDASWEIDLFGGGIARSVEAAQASLETSVYGFEDALVTLYGEIARNYVELRTTQMRKQVAMKNIVLQRETLKLAEERFRTGLAPELDVQQARTNLANTESEVPTLRVGEVEAVNRIAVLLGRFPQELEVDLYVESGVPDGAAQVNVVLPADLLRRRPDVRAAERQLAAQTANIGVAESDLYPYITLTGTFYLRATELSDMTDLSSREYTFGPAVRWNVFSAGRVRNNIRIEQMLTEEVRMDYEKAVLGAVEELTNAITGYEQEFERRGALERSVASSEKSVELVRSLYRNGLTDFRNVLDTERVLFSQQDRLAASRGQLVLDLIGIYKSLGGGWSQDMAEELMGAAQGQTMD